MARKKLTGIAILLFFLLVSCTNHAKEEYATIVAQWQGKEILFPDSVCTFGDSIPISFDADFTIIAYYDSTGCTSCRMKLPYWREFMDKVDSVAGKGTVQLLLIADRKEVRELSYSLKRTSLSANLYHDSEGRMNALNSFPEKKELQAFLIDSHHRVQIVGNPLISHEMEQLYLSKIGNGFEEDDEEYEEYDHDFGSIMPDEEVSHIFEMKNESPDTLKVSKVLTSCECTFGTVIPEKIPPHSVYRVETTFRDTVAGSFLRSVTVYFDNRPEIRFELTGVIK